MIAAVAFAGVWAEDPPCSCAAARERDGWCEAHRIGYVAGIAVPSKLVFEAVDAHGHELNPEYIQCETCKKAFTDGGFCELDRLGFVRGLAYFSTLTYELALGTRESPAAIKCRTCRKNAESQGWCERYKLGRIGPVALRDRAAYDRAAGAADLLRAANVAATRCEWCGVAVLTSTECPICRITYKGGKALPPLPKAAVK